MKRYQQKSEFKIRFFYAKAIVVQTIILQINTTIVALVYINENFTVLS